MKDEGLKMGKELEESGLKLITRADFHSMCADLFDRVMRPVNKVLSDQMMQPKDVDDVVLVGGAVRMPRIPELLAAKL